MAKLIELRYQDAFYATFDADVGELEQGDEICLQLPDNSDCQHDSNYSSETAQKCINLIDEIYSDEELSIMAIIEDTDLSDFEIRTCELSSLETDRYGDLNDVNWSIEVLKNGNSYYPIKESNIHKYYTNRFAWTLNSDAELRFADSKLVNAFDESDSVVRTAKDFKED